MAPSTRAITADDAAPLAVTLKRAFRDDPVMRWVFQSDGQWEAHALPYFHMLIRDVCRYGLGLTTADLAGGSLWQCPDPPARGFLRQLVSYLRLTFRFRSAFFRGLVIEEHLQAVHPSQPHWYLSVIGTDPSHQGQGVGTALMAPVLTRCDREGLVAYLESSNRDNLAFYRRFDFNIVTEVTIPSGPTLWPMLRQPRN